MSFPSPIEDPVDITRAAADQTLSDDHLAALEEVQRRVLWLSALSIHHANNVRPNPDGIKVGGHQASCASAVSIMTALYFHALQRGDRISIKPHASPVLHAIHYLLGNLNKEYLTTLRGYRGLQAYPSRTKDPFPVDFSTGSVGHGAVAPAFAALSHSYLRTHFGDVTSRRFISFIGDAELDEGNIWEAVIEEALAPAGNVLWIVDLNRQSLDRVIPGIRATEMKGHFAQSGWRVLEAKYGRALRDVFARPGGPSFRRAIDAMENEEYQTLIRLPGDKLRPRLINFRGVHNPGIEQAIADVPNEELPGLLANLGGHDMQDLIDIFEEGLRPSDQPTVIFCYTIKGWNMPFYGDALNHSAIMKDEQIEELREQIGIAEEDQWERFSEDSAAGQLCQEAFERLYAGEEPRTPAVRADQVPVHLGHSRVKTSSTQESFGRLMTQLADLEDVGPRIVTVSPDVSTSTNLGGWINKTGVFALSEATRYDEDDDNAPKLLRWEPKPAGQHIELGISEMNLFSMLGMLGLSHELSGQMVFPIGTVYDPFVLRGMDALVYSVYSGSKMVFAGTPSGITLAPEGGAHQSTITPSVGIELPGLRAYEPCFAQELEWALLDSLRQCCDRENGESTYLRLSTRPVDQTLFSAALDRIGQDDLRRQVLAGGYRIVDAAYDAPDTDPRDTVEIVAAGVMVPEAIKAAGILHQEGVAANVINLTSAQQLYAQWREWQRYDAGMIDGPEPTMHLDTLIPSAERRAPIVTLLDGASHTLAWIGSVNGAQVTALGVDQFGQSGTLSELYQHYEIDPERIAMAAFAALDRRDGV
ncbi:MAG: pyruvate dehydrogenase [Sphaerobacteraceae bacterium]|nr:MAG: pyruvate dehydrogenase [Sphaerobacteraceae bacterium]